MKKIGGKENAKFNSSTGEWEYEPVRYVEFHCTPKEWGNLGNGKYLLLRDYLRSIDLNDLAWKDVTVKDVIDLAIGDIICNRYRVMIEEKKEQLNGWNRWVWEVDVNGAPYYTYVSHITDSEGGRYVPELYEPISGQDERTMIRVLAGVCDAIYYLINSVEKGKYYEKYISGEYKIYGAIPDIQKIKL